MNDLPISDAVEYARRVEGKIDRILNIMRAEIEHRIDQQYQIALGRKSDPEGLQAYSEAVMSGRLTLDGVLSALLASDESKNRPVPPWVVPTVPAQPKPEPQPKPIAKPIISGFLYGYDAARKIATKSTMTYLSDQISDSERYSMIDYALSQGHTGFEVYIANDRDYDHTGQKRTFYTSKRQSKWVHDLRTVQAAGLDIGLWLMSDDGFRLFDRSNVDRVAAYWDQVFVEVIQHIDPVKRVVLGLEALEYWSESQCRTLGNWLRKRLPDAEIGFHTIERDTRLLSESWIDAIYFQFGFGRRPEDCVGDVLALQRDFGKPVYAAEYSMDSTSDAAKKIGRACISNGCIGALNGA